MSKTKDRKKWFILGKVKSPKTKEHFLLLLSKHDTYGQAQKSRIERNMSQVIERTVKGEPEVMFWFADELFITYGNVPREDAKVTKFVKIKGFE